MAIRGMKAMQRDYVRRRQAQARAYREGKATLPCSECQDAVEAGAWIRSKFWPPICPKCAGKRGRR